MRMAIVILACGFVFEAAALGWCDVVSPRLVRDDDPDPVSLDRFATDPAWAKLSDREFAERLFGMLTHPERGLQVLEPTPQEGPDKVAAWAGVTDPVKVMSVYGYGQPRVLAATMAAVWKASRRGLARVIEFDGGKIVLTEVQSSGRWWAFDVAGRAQFPSDHGFASVDELRKDDAPWRRDRGPAFYPDVDPATVAAIVRTGEGVHDMSPAATGHSLEYVLRRGESFVRFADPLGHRWRMTDADAKSSVIKNVWATEPAGPKTSAEAAPLQRNGVFVYAPKLGNDPADFEDGVFRSGNVVVGPGGLTLGKEGAGFAIFDFHSPFLIVPELGKLEDAKDNQDAAVIEIDGAGVTLSVSPDYGATWISLEAKSFPARIDATEQVAGTYGYLLRLDLSGKADAAVVRSLKVTNWVQLSRASLPSLTEGLNRFQLKTGDGGGVPGLPICVTGSTADENAFLRPIIRPPREFHPEDKAVRVRGPFTARLAAPEGMKLSGFSVGGRVVSAAAGRGQAAMTLGYQVAQPTNFLPLEVPIIPREHTANEFEIQETVRLPAPAASVYVRVESRDGLNDFRLIGHCVRDLPRPRSPLTIVHRWKEADTEKDHTTTAGPEDARVEVTAGPNPHLVSIEFRVDGTP